MDMILWVKVSEMLSSNYIKKVLVNVAGDSLSIKQNSKGGGIAACLQCHCSTPKCIEREINDLGPVFQTFGFRVLFVLSFILALNLIFVRKKIVQMHVLVSPFWFIRFHRNLLFFADKSRLAKFKKTSNLCIEVPVFGWPFATPPPSMASMIPINLSAEIIVPHCTSTLRPSRHHGQRLRQI